MTLDTTGLKELFRSLEDCCLHDPDWGPDDVEKVILGYDPPSNDSDWSDWFDSYTIVLLRNGSYGLLIDGQDLTGHGCQCSSFTGIYDSLEHLLTLGIPEGNDRDEIRKELEAGEQ